MRASGDAASPRANAENTEQKTTCLDHSDPALAALIRRVFRNAKENHPGPRHFPIFCCPQLSGSLVPDNDFAELCELMLGSDHHLFVRAPEGGGVSTIAKFLAAHSPNDVVYIMLTEDDLDRKKFEKRLLYALKAKNIHELKKKLVGKLLIVDESHLMLHHTDILNLLISEGLQFFLLMISLASVTPSRVNCRHKLGKLTTPALVTNECFMNLRFSSSDIQQLVELSNLPSTLCSAVESKTINEGEATQIISGTLESLLSGHRLLTVFALDCLRNSKLLLEKPHDAPDAVTQLLHKRLRHDVFVPDKTNNCRGAIVNSLTQMYDLQLVCTEVLCDGLIDAGRRSTAVKTAVGALLPRVGLEPLCVNSTVFSWTNAFVARFFAEKHRFAAKKIAPRICKTDTISLVLLGLAWMDVNEYVGCVGGAERVYVQMPFKQQLLAGLEGGWARFPHVLQVEKNVASGESTQGPLLDCTLTVVGEATSRFVKLATFGKLVDDSTTPTGHQDAVADHISAFFPTATTKKATTSQRLEAMTQGDDIVLVIFSRIEKRAEAVEQASRTLRFHKDEQHGGVKSLKVLLLGMHSSFRYSVDVVEVKEDASGAKVVSNTSVVEDLLANLNAKYIREDGTLASNQRQPTALEHLTSVKQPVALTQQEADTDL